MLDFQTRTLTIHDRLQNRELVVEARETHARNGDFSFKMMGSRYLVKPDGAIFKCNQYGRFARWERVDYIIVNYPRPEGEEARGFSCKAINTPCATGSTSPSC